MKKGIRTIIYSFLIIFNLVFAHQAAHADGNGNNKKKSQMNVIDAFALPSKLVNGLKSNYEAGEEIANFFKRRPTAAAGAAAVGSTALATTASVAGATAGASTIGSTAGLLAVGAGVISLAFTFPISYENTDTTLGEFIAIKLPKWIGRKLAYSVGYYIVPGGLTEVKPRSAKHPDGALRYDSLTHDPFDSSSAKIRSTFNAISKGEPIKNGIYYGEAGTGKTASVRSFSHLPNFKVYSIDAKEVNLEKFSEITIWLKNASSKSRRIIIDFSEGDDMLFDIAYGGYESSLKDYFKRNYDRVQAHYGIIFSCNYNLTTSYALKAIGKEEELRRRIEDRIEFKLPTEKVRLSLLQQSVNETLDKRFQDDEEILGYFQNDFFRNTDILVDHVVPTTADMSHSRILSLGEKLVFLFDESRSSYNNGVSDKISQFDFIDGKTSTIDNPTTQITKYLHDKKMEREWIQNQESKLMDDKIEELEQKIPLLIKQNQVKGLEKSLENGTYFQIQNKDKLPKEDTSMQYENNSDDGQNMDLSNIFASPAA